MIHAPALYNGGGLTSVDHPVRVLFVMLFIILLGVIISCQLYNIRTPLCIFPGHIIGADGHGGIFCRIIFFHQFLQIPGSLLSPLVCMGVIDFISDTPKDHTGMISVSLYPAFHIPCGPLLEKSGIIICCFSPLPHIKGFRDHKKPHLIGKLCKTGCHHIVGSSYCIYSHFF